MLKLELKLYGQVQRVGYRYAIYDHIKTHFPHVRGYVKNLADGSVELVVYGSLEELKKMRTFAVCGVERAFVRDVKEEITPVPPEIIIEKDFKIISE